MSNRVVRVTALLALGLALMLAGPSAAKSSKKKKKRHAAAATHTASRNPRDPRIFTPPALVWGWSINLYTVLRRFGIMRQGDQ